MDERKMRRLKNSIYAYITGRFIEGQMELDMLSKGALKKILHVRIAKLIKENDLPPLSAEEKAEIDKVYKGYPLSSYEYHRVYKGLSGKFYPEYMPEDLYYCYIEDYFSDKEASRYIDNKCYYPKMFAGMKQPETIVFRMGGVWLDADYNIISPHEVLMALSRSNGDLIMKIAENSERSYGVFLMKENEVINSFRKNIKKIPKSEDVIVQRVIKQHPDYAKLNPGSVNAYRVISFLNSDTNAVEILKLSIRIGIDEHISNTGGRGGVLAGVNENGELTPCAYGLDCKCYYKHPVYGYKFGDITVPFVDRVIEYVKKGHPMVSRFKIISWDLGVDEEGDPVLMETNLTMSGILYNQLVDGPLFGDHTKQILKKVFKK